MENNIILAFFIFVAGLIWFLFQYNKSQLKKPRNPYEEMVYQEEIARNQARDDFRIDKRNQLKNDKWRRNLGRNIERSWF